MWIETMTIENIKCFEKQEIAFWSSKKKKKHTWITLLGDNGSGKSTILQALGLLLAGPEGAAQFSRSVTGWLRDEDQLGKIGIVIHQGKNDPGQYGGTKIYGKFSYNYAITGSKRLEVGKEQKVYTEPTILEGEENKHRLSWLRENALLPKGKGWFAAGYGAFRRLTRKEGQFLLPSLQTPLRYTNFQTQFEEDQPLTAFEHWLIYLDYQVSKNGDSGKTSRHQMDMGIAAVNKLLPAGSFFDHIDGQGKIWFEVNGTKIPTLSLSDGYRSVLSLAGDLIWRLTEAFPQSEAPLEEEGVVLIDELDIHLHPIWQRDIAQLLRSIFPNIQFIVATHSPLVAAGAGKEAVAYRVARTSTGDVEIQEIKNIAFKDMDNILQGPAFGVASTYSKEAEEVMRAYLELKAKPKRNKDEQKQFEELAGYAREMFKSSSSLSDEDRQLRDDMIQHLKSKLAVR
jgi:predicted ATPase